MDRPITLNEFIKALSETAQMANNGDRELVSIGTCSGDIMGLRCPYSLRLRNKESGNTGTVYVPAYTEQPEKKKLVDEGVPVYTETLRHAVSHNEKPAFLDSHEMNERCREALDSAIAENFVDNSLKAEKVLDSILEKFSFMRVKYVLSTTILNRIPDGRISMRNIGWAERACSYPSHEERGFRTPLKSHSGLVDILVTYFRKRDVTYVNGIDLGVLDEKFSGYYKALYDAAYVPPDYHKAIDVGEKFITENPGFMEEFNAFRGDIITSDREIVAMVYALRDMGKISFLTI